jgi:transposase InsO family protein
VFNQAVERMGHRITGNPRDNANGAGSEYLFVAVDDHARIGFTPMKPHERRSCAIALLRASIRNFFQLGSTVRRVLTDNGSAFRSKRFAAACRGLKVKHKFTRAGDRDTPALAPNRFAEARATASRRTASNPRQSPPV